MKNVKNIKKMILLFICAGAFSAMLLWGIKVQLISSFQQIQFEKKCSEKSISTTDLSSIGYLIENGQYTARENDPQLEVQLNSEMISSLDIRFQNKLDEGLAVQIFYAENGNGFSEENSMKGYIESGDKEFSIELFKKDITSLRIDLGDVVGASFSLDNIILNDKKNVSTLREQIRSNSKEIQWGRFFCQWELLCLTLVFLGMHLIFDIKEMYDWIFKRRWLVAAFILLFLVLNKFNGESSGIYNQIIQPHIETEYSNPIFGKAQGIRSDDYVVDTPNKLASIHDGVFEKYNETARGTKTLNGVFGVYIGYSTIAKNPFQFAYAILSYEYAYSFCWYAPIILCFMLAIELFYVLSGKNSLLAVTGASLEVLSSFYLWWGLPNFLLGAQGALVCVYYFVRQKSKIKKILLGFGVAIAFSSYVLTLYPAWIVPMGYVVLCCLIWIISQSWEDVKSLKIVDWLFVFLMAVFAISLLISYFKLNQEYTYAITHTLYPGKRSESGGGAIGKMFFYAQSFLYAYHDIGNPAEASAVLSFFPIPIIISVRALIKEKKKDFFLIGMLAITTVLCIYSFWGLPSIIAKITLLNFSTANRTADIIGLIQIFLFVYTFGKYRESSAFSVPIGGVIAVGITAVSIFFSYRAYPFYWNLKCFVLSIVIVFTMSILLLCGKNVKMKNLLCYTLIFLSIGASISIRPISRGLDSITAKPVSKKIQQIVAEDKSDKWMTYGGTFHFPGFAIANGAATINSTNTYPNLELWETLDPEKKYEKIYNRYSHITMNFTDNETSFKQLSMDQIQVDLSYKDIEKTKVKYILSLEPIEADNRYVSFEKLYEEDGCYIYEIHYLQS